MSSRRLLSSDDEDEVVPRRSSGRTNSSPSASGGQSSTSDPSTGVSVDDLLDHAGDSDVQGDEVEPAEEKGGQTTSTIDADMQALFGSDSDDDDDMGSRSRDPFQDSDDDAGNLRASGKKDRKKKRRKPTKAEKPSRRKRRKDEAEEGAVSGRKRRASRSSSGAADGDAYDSGDEVVRTGEDDAFLDLDGDDAGLLAEYEQENKQQFDLDQQERVASTVGKGKSKGSAANEAQKALIKRYSGGGGRLKARELTEFQQDRTVENLKQKMFEAYERDLEAMERGELALHKLSLMKQVRPLFRRHDLHEAMVENGILEVLNTYLKPLPVERSSLKALPNYDIRTAIYGILQALPVTTDSLLDSKIGFTLEELYKHKRETKENKRTLQALIRKFMSLFFGKRTSYKQKGKASRGVVAEEEKKGGAKEEEEEEGVPSSVEKIGERIRRIYNQEEGDEDGDYSPLGSPSLSSPSRTRPSSLKEQLRRQRENEELILRKQMEAFEEQQGAVGDNREGKDASYKRAHIQGRQGFDF